MIAHVGGVPVEEILPTLAGAGSGAAGHGHGAEAAPATPTEVPDMTDTKTLRIERTFQAPAEAVFDAWTSEEVIRRWWHAEHDWETTEAEVDLRVGGVVRVVMRDPDKDVEYGGGGTLHGDRAADPPGVHLDLGRRHAADADRARLRGDRRRHHGQLHPQRPLGRGGGALARGRVGQALRQPRTHAGGGSPQAWPAPLLGRAERVRPKWTRRVGSVTSAVERLPSARAPVRCDAARRPTARLPGRSPAAFPARPAARALRGEHVRSAVSQAQITNLDRVLDCHAASLR